MAYTRFYSAGWQSGASGGTPITPEALTHMEDGIVAAQSPRNLLDNSDFTNPVNQRGAASYAGAQYSIDRWRTWSADMAVGVSDDGIVLTNTGTASNQFVQYLDGKKAARLTGKKLTFACYMANGNVYCVTGVGGAITSNAAMGANENCYIQIGYGNSGLIAAQIFTLAGATSKAIAHLALYEGEYTAETLPKYQPKGYGVELAECRRYTIPLGGFIRYRPCQITTTVIDFFIPLPQQMRAIPSFDTSALTVYGVNGTTATAQDGFAFECIQNGANGILVRATKANHGLTDAMFNINAGTIFSADL